MTTSPELLRRHAEHLAAEHRVSLYWTAHPYGAAFHPDYRAIYAPDIRHWGVVQSPDGSSREDFTPRAVYWITMHELGHAALRHTGVFSRAELLREEAEAWEWAANHSSIPVDAELGGIAVRALQTYTGRSMPEDVPPKLRYVADRLSRGWSE